MADLLGSILGSMQKPPTIPNSEKKRVRAQQKQIESQHQKEKESLSNFRLKIQNDVECFVRDSQRKKFKFKTMPKVFRAVIHDVAEVAGLVSFSFGEEDVDRHIVLWKKEFAPSDEELAAYRLGEEWSEEKAKEMLGKKVDETETQQRELSSDEAVHPATNYRDKYKHLIGEDAGKQAASSTVTSRNYGFVSSENKRDLRTIEEVLAETKARKKQKTSSEENSTSMLESPIDGQGSRIS